MLSIVNNSFGSLALTMLTLIQRLVCGDLWYASQGSSPWTPFGSILEKTFCSMLSCFSAIKGSPLRIYIPLIEEKSWLVIYFLVTLLKKPFEE